MNAALLALLLQANPSPPVDLGATGPRQEMGFGKSYCALRHLPVGMHGGGGTWGIWSSAPATLSGATKGELYFGIDTKPGVIWPDMRALALRFKVTLAPGVTVERARLFIDGKAAKLNFTLRRFNNPAEVWPEIEGRADEPYEQPTSEAVVKLLLKARTAEFRFHDKARKQVAAAGWDVSKVRWMPIALKRNGFTCVGDVVPFAR